jgi:hypothetical protein
MLPTSRTALSSQPFTEATMRVQDLSDYEYAHKRLSYDPETGILYWKDVGSEFFNSLRGCNIFKKSYANTVAGGINGQGYRLLKYNGKKVPAHRIVWLMVNGDWPTAHVDHINGDRLDNRIENLRVVENDENARNRRMPANNTSGVMGVTWSNVHGRWMSQITNRGSKKHLGLFDDFDEAVVARKAAEIRYGYHPNHGRK